MSKQVAPIKVTSGGGFVFENKCGAYFLSCMLFGRPPIDPEFGSVTHIDYQVRADGWLLDDILLSFKQIEKTRNRCAVSIKSNAQFGVSTAPSEFVHLIWEQYLVNEKKVFDCDKDYLGLLTGPLSTDLVNDIEWLIEICQKQTSEIIPKRLQEQGAASTKRRELFDSFACPPELATTYSIGSEKTGKLLGHVRIYPFDFEYTSSTKEKDAISYCRDALASGTLQEANELWTALQVISDEYRIAGGQIDLTVLLDCLRGRFKLKAYREYGHDWELLVAQTKQTLQTMPDKIGGHVTLSRKTYLDQIENATADHPAIVLIGETGCGKTVIQKQFALRELDNNLAVWLDAEQLDDSNVEDVIKGLSHSLLDIFRSAHSNRANLIIDGIDRIYQEKSFQRIALLINSLRLDNANSPWRMLLSCQPHEWRRIQKKLLRVGLDASDWHVIPVSQPSIDELKPVWDKFPSLKPLMEREKLASLIARPKILDIMALQLAIAAIPDTRKWAGESDLIQWFWSAEISQGTQGAAFESFLYKLAQIQGDELKIGIPLDRFLSAELHHIAPLEQKRICLRKEGKLSFGHDLYGDWARQRVLISHNESIKEFVLSRLDSPLWQRALKLYGLHLLEQNADVKEWRRLLQSTLTEDGKNNLVLFQDILLEASIHAVDSSTILERIWEDLQQNDGELLRRLLTSFLHVATLPNPLVLKLVKNVKDYSETEASTINRIPIKPYWLPVIAFLYKHLNRCIELAPDQVAEIAWKWLTLDKKSLPYQKEAAELGIAVAWWVYLISNSANKYQYLHRFESEKAYRAALVSANVFPDQVAEFSLAVCGRKDEIYPPITIDLPEEQAVVPRDLNNEERLSAFIAIDPGVDIPQWPDGPSLLVDRAFRNLCLDDSTSLLPLIIGRPDIAIEIILALLIKAPGKRARHNQYDIHRAYELNEVHSWSPPLYGHGPFIYFLMVHPKKGTELIHRLVNFMTDRWADILISQSQVVPSITVSLPTGDRRLRGNGELYYAYRDVGHWPNVIVCALMALEKWLYMTLEEGKDVTEVVDVILETSTSVALAGVLVGVAKKHTELFSGRLKPFLAIPEIYHWELIHHRKIFGETLQMAGWNIHHRAERVKLAQEWHNMPHRKEELHKVVTNMFLLHSDIRSFIDTVHEKWIARRNSANADDVLRNNGYLDRLIREFDIANWMEVEHPEHGRGWVLNMPTEIQEQQKKAWQELDDKKLLMLFPMQCKDMLDKNQALAPNEIEPFWDKLQYIKEMKIPEDVEPDLVGIQDPLCGGIAVLMQLHRDWLKAQPEKETWCIQQIANIIQKPPRESELDIETSDCDWRWDRFCALIIPIYWAENASAQFLRDSIIFLVMNRHYNTVKILFMQAARFRKLLSDDFIRMQHFLLRWSVARWRLNYGYSWGGPSHCDEKDKKIIIDEMDKYAQQFVDASLSPVLPLWKELAFIDTRPSLCAPDSRGKYYPRNPGIDLELIQAAYSWLPVFHDALNDNEREQILAFWREAVNTITWMLGNGSEEIREIDGMPFKFDQWVFPNLVQLILQLPKKENQREFWLPILNLGVPGKYWISEFLFDWFTFNIESHQQISAFTAIWQQILDFAFASPRWDYKLAKPSHELEILWSKLMGIDEIPLFIWDAKKQSMVDNMRRYYERWAGLSLQHEHCVANYIDFLQTPAAEPIRLESVNWLYKAASLQKDGFWYDRHYHIEDKLARLLDSCWMRHLNVIRATPIFMNSFRKLLTALVERKNSIAMELSDRLILDVEKKT